MLSAICAIMMIAVASFASGLSSPQAPNQNNTAAVISPLDDLDTSPDALLITHNSQTAILPDDELPTDVNLSKSYQNLNGNNTNLADIETQPAIVHGNKKDLATDQFQQLTVNRIKKSGTDLEATTVKNKALKKSNGKAFPKENGRNNYLILDQNAV